MDCHPLLGVINRQAPLKAPSLEPQFEKMTSNVFNILQQGYCLPSPVADPVVWHCMCFNKIAGHLVNHTMDFWQSWVQEFEPPVRKVLTASANFTCHSDGGTCCDSCSSLGWYTEVVVTTPDSIKHFPVVMRHASQQASFAFSVRGVCT